ncbi:MAG: VacJ family lipoprotein [Zoogloeaceae bacterium]|jgi:phospholipid-binding lipoprotein MlaA|nr:VacJ family lipoprotein [Zoogloeaceae bacterium]
MSARNYLTLCGVLCLLFLSGCAAQRVPMAQDPFEGFNRAMFAVQEGLDTTLLKPLAQGYDAAVPVPVKAGFGNFFDNFRDLPRGGNALLQGKGEQGATSLARIFINSTLGMLGLFDVASEMGLERGGEDFGQTLALWGVPPGPYLFLPVIGPSGGRDLVGWWVDAYASPLWYLVGDDPATRNSLYGINIMHFRAALLPADHILEEASLDKYAYLRSAYLQRRASLIRGNSPTPLPPDDEPDDSETESDVK